MEFVELQRLLQDARVDRVTETGWLVILVSDVSKVLVNLDMPSITGIPLDSCTVGDILVAVDVILELL
jgi:hypothetical protein